MKLYVNVLALAFQTTVGDIVSGMKDPFKEYVEEFTVSKKLDTIQGTSSTIVSDKSFHHSFMIFIIALFEFSLNLQSLRNVYSLSGSYTLCFRVRTRVRLPYACPSSVCVSVILNYTLPQYCVRSLMVWALFAEIIHFIHEK